MAKIRDDLIGSVLVANPDGGDPIVLTAGDKVPKGIELGDHVLAAKSSKDDGAHDGGDGGGEQPPPPPVLVIPPRGGAGSGADVWREYAAAAAAAAGLNIEIAADASRDDIIEALKGAGIPTE